MALREEFQRTGNWLFRWRSYLPIFLILLILPAMHQLDFSTRDRQLQMCWEFFCMAISFCGLGIRVYTIGHTPEGTSGRNTKAGQVAAELNTTGIYSIVRHPLYLGNFIIWLGVSMFCPHWWLPALFALVFWVYYERIMFAEEEFLRDKFGAAYMDWADVTPAFIPSLKNWKRPALPFSLRTVLRREYSGFFAIIAVFYALVVYKHLALQPEISVDPIWSATFLGGLVVYLTLRTLKRNTALLVVEGR